MPKYKCLNEECPLYKQVKFQNAKIRIIDSITGDVKDMSLECPECKKDREEVKDEFNGFTTTMHGSANIARR